MRIRDDDGRYISILVVHYDSTVFNSVCNTIVYTLL